MRNAGKPKTLAPDTERKELLMHSSNTSVRSVVQTMNLGMSLLRYGIGQTPKEDLLYCPLGLSLAMGMTMNGMRGDTWTESAGALQPGSYSDKNALNADYAALLSYLTPEQLGVSFELAQGIWAAKHIVFNAKFLSDNKNNFGCELRTADFGNADFVLNDEQEGLNPWVKRKTKFIPKILDSLDPNAIMLLVSAMYFEGDWTIEFPLDDTDELNWYGPDGSAPHAIMHQLASHRFQETDDYQIVALPFARQRRLHKVVLLPKGRNTIKSVLDKIDASTIWQLIHTNPTYGHLFYPRHKVNTNVDLKAAMIALGATKAFGGGDFGDLARGNIKISRIVQANFARYDELGGAGGSATVVQPALEACIRQEPRAQWTMMVNRPCVNFLVDFNSGATLFSGVLNRPTAIPAPKPRTK